MNESVRTIINTPVGPLVVSGTARGVTDIYFFRQQLAESPPRRSNVAATAAHSSSEGATADVPLLNHGRVPAPVRDAARQLDEYFRGLRRRFEFPIDLAGTAFERAVWDYLLTIPYGATCTYGAVAASIGRPGAARAVGAAVGRNPISIVVPCHRVVASGGQLGGYGGGLDRKRFLLQLEGIVLNGRGQKE